MDGEEILKILKALGEETRIQIFEMLRGGKLCACKILERFRISQPTLSHHMKILCDCGIVIAEKDWKWTYYSLNGEKLNALADYFGNPQGQPQTTCLCNKNTCE